MESSTPPWKMLTDVLQGIQDQSKTAKTLNAQMSPEIRLLQSALLGLGSSASRQMPSRLQGAR
jgi:hypothetical protein